MQQVSHDKLTPGTRFLARVRMGDGSWELFRSEGPFKIFIYDYVEAVHINDDGSDGETTNLNATRFEFWTA